MIGSRIPRGMLAAALLATLSMPLGTPLSTTASAAAPATGQTGATASAASPPGAAAPPPVTVVFPDAVDPKYYNEVPPRARMLTCRDQFNANISAGGNGGLRWLQQGGGYYPACDRHLQG